MGEWCIGRNGICAGKISIFWREPWTKQWGIAVSWGSKTLISTIDHDKADEVIKNDPLMQLVIKTQVDKAKREKDMPKPMKELKMEDANKIKIK